MDPWAEYITLATRKDLERFGLYEGEFVMRDDNGDIEVVKLKPDKNTYFRMFPNGSIEFLALYGDFVPTFKVDKAATSRMKARYLLHSFFIFQKLSL